MNIWGRTALCALMAIHLGVLSVVAVNRLSKNAVIDESEDMHSRCSYTLATGESLYGSDDIHIQRKDYTPLSFWFYSLAVRSLGLDIRYQRAVAFLFGLGAIFLAGLITTRLTGSYLWGFFASSLLSGIETGIWYIEVSPQPVHVFFALLGVFILVRDSTLNWKTLLAAGLAFFACYWSKQTGLAYLFCYILFAFTKGIKKGIAAFALVSVMVGGSTLYYAMQPDSNFIRLVFVWNSLDPIIWKRIWNPVIFPEITGRFGILVSILLSALFMIKRNNYKDWLSPQIIFTIGGLAAGSFASLKYGSGNNQVIVGYACLIISGLWFLNRWVNQNRFSFAMVGGLLAIQSIALIHPVTNNLIYKDDQERFEKIVSFISNQQGVTKFFDMGYYNILAGKKAINDPIIDGFVRQKTGQLVYRKFMKEYVETVPFDTVIVPLPFSYNTSLMIPIFKTHYDIVGEIPPSPRSGGALRRHIIFMVKKK